MLATQAGFQSLYVSGAAIAYTRLGRPDIGLVSMTEVVDTVALIRDRVDADLIVDADTGYGNALNVERTVRAVRARGRARDPARGPETFPSAAAISTARSLIPAGEMGGKIRAAVDARRSARHADHRAHRRGRGRRLRRARSSARVLYREAGADVLFVEAPKARERARRHRRTALGRAVPLMANMVEGGKTPHAVGEPSSKRSASRS